MLLCEPRLLIADEPTRGVDVGAKRAIYEMLVSLAESGMGILLISSELEEILGLSDRVIVMRRGRTVAELAGAEPERGIDPRGRILGDRRHERRLGSRRERQADRLRPRCAASGS